MTARNAALFFAVLLVLALIATFPLRLALALSDAPLHAANVTGSVWSGHVERAEIAGMSFRDATLRLEPLALLASTARFAILSDAVLPGLPFPVPVQAAIDLPGGNVFAVETRIVGVAPALEERLTMMGFTQDGDVFVRRDEGSFTP